jgi:valyl-tRNA synthetase
MQAVIDLISRVRNIRSEMNIKPSDRIQLLIAANAEMQPVFSSSADQIARLTRADSVSVDGTGQMPKASARAVLAGGAEVAVPLEGLIDFAQERARLLREREKLEKEAAKLKAQLGNADFVSRAPAEKVAELRERVADIDRQTAALDQMVEALSCIEYLPAGCATIAGRDARAPGRLIELAGRRRTLFEHRVVSARGSRPRRHHDANRADAQLAR